MKRFLRCLLVLTGLLLALGASAGAEGVVINEVMSRNTLYIPVDGEYAGWIEVINTSDAAVDISGWYLTDSVIFKDAFRFRDTVLAPGETAIVYAAGVAQSVYDPVNVAEFRVSKAGETLTLADSRGDAVDVVDVPALNVDESYARDPETGEWSLTYEATPTMANLRENYAQLYAEAMDVGAQVVISEAMASNKSYLAAQGCPDWIELSNLGETDVDLTGWRIGDDPEDPNSGFALPQTVLGPGEYLLIYADGKNCVDEDGGLHAGFSLSSSGECLVLADGTGKVVSRMYFGELGRDVSCARMNDGSFSTAVTPSPGWPNTEKGAQQARLSNASSGKLNYNDYGLYINEVMACTDVVNLDRQSYDWVELVNLSENTIDLSGFGLSDNESRPRKWQFPAGATIAPGEYLVVALAGGGESDVAAKKYRASFALAATEGEVLTLSLADGTVIDRVGLGVQRQNVSFGRPLNGDRYAYFMNGTPGSINNATAYDAIAADVVFSVPGGIVTADSITLSLSAGPGMSIYYTLDCTEPTLGSTLYTGPITISSNTVVRAVAWREGAVYSQIATQTYIFGEDTQLRMVSVVAEPSSLYGETGIITNSNKARNVNANVEVYTVNGDQMLDQGCRMRLMGAGSLKQSQKSIKLIADAKYGDNLFRASLFSNRDYTEYASFILRSSGQDSWKTRMHDSILTSLLAGTSVLYQETETCVVYVNGQYYGHMNMRERLNDYSICQFHGWDDPEDLDILENKGKTVKGSRDDWFTFIKWVYATDMTKDENVAIVEQQVDLENYLTYVAFQMYIANNDLGNVRWYRNRAQDGKWRFAAYDVDLSWQTDQNSFARWLKEGGVGTITRQDNTLFRCLMQNEKIQDRFLTILGNLMATNFSTANVQKKIEERYQEIHDDAVQTFLYYGEGDEAKWNKAVTRFYNYAATRPAKLLGYIQETTGMTDEQMRHYFGDVMDQISGVAVSVDDAEAYEDEAQIIEENPREELDGDAEAETEAEEPEDQEFVDLLP